MARPSGTSIAFVVLLVMVFGGFALTGGALGPVMEAVPHEMMIIGGAEVGAMIAGTSVHVDEAGVRAASDTEVAVRPLRNPATADLRDLAAGQQARGALADAAATLDRALAITPDDPALLQERAEAALLLGDYAAAEAHARRAHAIGSQVGPLCRRHWTTVEQVRLAAGDRGGADAAVAQVAECRVDRPARY